MIDQKIFEIAQVHADSLKEATGKVILARGNSALSNLVALSAVLPVKLEGSTISYADMVSAATSDQIEGPSLHTASMALEVDALVPLVTNQVSFIQNSVKPRLIEFEKKMAAVDQEFNSRNPVGLFEIVPVSQPTPLQDEALMALVERFADENVATVGVLGTLPAASIEDLMKVMTVSSSVVDNELKSWLNERGANWLLNIWQRYFATIAMAEVQGAPKYHGGLNEIRNMNNYQRMEVALAVFLLARGLLDEPMDGAGMDLNQWRSTMDAISRFAANQVKQAMGLTSTETARKALILSFDSNSKRVTVNAPVYLQYLNEGGSVEDILGAAISDTLKLYSIDVLRDRGEFYRSTWRNYENVANFTLTRHRQEGLVNAATTAFANMCDCVCPEEQILMSERGMSFDAMRAKAAEIINQSSLAQLRDARDLGLRLIAGVRFAHTPAETFLRDMLAAEDAGCKDAQEAAYIATINYVCRYAASLLGLSDDV